MRGWQLAGARVTEAPRSETVATQHWAALSLTQQLHVGAALAINTSESKLPTVADLLLACHDHPQLC